jgi:hypothetical protein
MIRLDEIDQHKLDKRCNANHWSNCCKPKKNSIIVLQMQCKRLSMKEGICHLQELKLIRVFLFE